MSEKEVSNQLPECWKCKKVVDEVSLEYDHKDRESMYTVKCHGDKQIIKLADILKIECDISVGYAFKDEVIEKKEVKLMNNNPTI